MNVRALVIVIVAFSFSSVAEARSPRVQQLPNGDAFTCLTCHNNSFPTGSHNAGRNVFGAQVEQHLTGAGAISGQEVDWQAVYDLDADGDGFTNGEELVDPDGLWEQGDPDPDDWVPSNPADSDDTPDMGDQDCDAGEEFNPSTEECEPATNNDAGGGSEDAGQPDAGQADVGQSDAGGPDAGDQADAGGGEQQATNDKGSQSSCSSLGRAQPGAGGALALALILGLVATRRSVSR
jgi:hypothetical protein